MAKFKNLVGYTFGRLYVESIKGKTKDNKRYIYHCKCICGNDCDVLGELLSSGKTKSCGCLRKETTSKRNKKYNTYDLSGSYGIGYTSKGEEFYFDLEDYEKIKEYCWLYSNGYVISNLYLGNSNSKCVTLSRLLMEAPEGYVVDHINHDKRDNRKINLRIVTVSQNGMNMIPPQDKEYECRGIEYNSKVEKWVSRITVNNKRISLGYFNILEDAITTRKEAEEKYYGEYKYNPDAPVLTKINL